MKQIGNLAVVCARRQDVLLQVGSEKVCVHVGAGPERNTLHAAWNDDDAIQRIVHELNFGRYAAGRNGDGHDGGGILDALKVLGCAGDAAGDVQIARIRMKTTWFSF